MFKRREKEVKDMERKFCKTDWGIGIEEENPKKTALRFSEFFSIKKINFKKF